MKLFILAAIALGALFQFGGLVWHSNDHLTANALLRFIEPPPRIITNPYQNGYFYFFGLNAAPPLSPIHAGYDVWIKTSQDTYGDAAIQRGPRSELSPSVSPEFLSAQWEGKDPLSEFRKTDNVLQIAIRDHRIFLTRYEHWLGLPFEDWGFGSRAQPRYRDLMAVHRLYIAEGFSLDTLRGLERIRKEFLFWRFVLREAKTIHTKVFAQVVMTDDLRLLSDVLARPNIDKNILILGAQLTVPLTQSEYSLRWPIRSQLALAAKGRTLPSRSDHEPHALHLAEQEWLLQNANLPSESFKHVEHPPALTTLGVTLQSAQAGETYATYYETATKASESKTKHFPRMPEITSTIQRGLAERLLNPHPIEPDWGRFYTQLMETDTRLRLASLQIQLRRPNGHTSVPKRLAEVGSQYFDPFSGLPMLWSPTQQKLYSVGEDLFDDGGDPTFDLSVSAMVEPLKTATHSAGTARNTARNRR